MADEVRQFTVAADDEGIRLDRWFKRHLPQVGFATVSRWARTGQIRVDGKRAKPEDRLAAGQVLRVPPGGDLPKGKPVAKRRALSAEQVAEAEAMVLTQDRAAIVLNKPPGLATQGGTKTTSHVDGLLDAFVGEDDPRPRLVHRLDKDTSGVLLIARTPGSAAFFSKRFSGRSAKKVYWALVMGVPEVSHGMIEAPLAKQPGTGGEKMHVDEESGQPAKTRYRMIERAGNAAAWVELEPLTGRTHQLRAHMAAIGHPIVGDGKYGGRDAFLTGSVSRKMHLHARRLIIDHPDKTKLDITAPLPDHFAASMQQLGFDESLSDASPTEGPPEKSKDEKKQAARQHAKQLRKSKPTRRGRADARNPAGPEEEQALMHPNPLFRSEDRALFEALIGEIGFGMVFAGTPDGPRVAHTPLLSTGDGAVQFHLARGNGLTRWLDGTNALVVVNGPDAYVSPRWYADRATVPTWDYVTLEMEGRVRRMDADALDALLYALIERHEARLADVAGIAPWHSDETPPETWRKLAGAIVGFELEVQAWRPTLKLSQKKSPAERAAIAQGHRDNGAPALAELMRSFAP